MTPRGARAEHVLRGALADVHGEHLHARRRTRPGAPVDAEHLVPLGHEALAARMRPTGTLMPVISTFIEAPRLGPRRALARALGHEPCDRALHRSHVRATTTSSSSLPCPRRAAARRKDLQLHGQRQRHQVRGDGHVGRAHSCPSLEFHRGHGLAAAQDGHRDDGRAGLHREAHEARAEVHQGVALPVELGGAARALGEDHEEPLVAQQPLGVLGQARELPRARLAICDAKGTRLMNFSAMPCARRGGSSSKKAR
jgi:hypothetical protein